MQNQDRGHRGDHREHINVFFDVVIKKLLENHSELRNRGGIRKTYEILYIMRKMLLSILMDL